MDLNNDNKISYEEFKIIMNRYTNKELTDDQIHSFFMLIDDDGSGTISYDEINSFFLKLGKTYEKDYIKRIISALDKDGDGLISYEEFKLMCTNKL